MASTQSPSPFLPERDAVAPPQRGRDLFLISWLILFLELACIRWFPAHVLYLTFFTNTVLLACFLGMSVGCLAANRPRNYLAWTPALLVLAMAAALGVEWLQDRVHVDVGNQAAPQLVFFGTEYTSAADVSRFFVPIEVLGGSFFLVLALALVGPGQELGRALNRFPNRVWAYTINLLGSVAGIVLFAFFSWCQLTPFWWFLPIALTLGYLLWPPAAPPRRVVKSALLAATLLVVLGLASLPTGLVLFAGQEPSEHPWSPYYRIDYLPAQRHIAVNLIGHQQMVSRDAPVPAYALPYLLHRDAGGAPFADVLVIGAGSGNDVSRALQWGAAHVDAVEIDPVIQRLGLRDHPDRPYQDERVTTHFDDGRNFLRSTGRRYDLIVYALVDSLVLHSGYSNIRLESYLFTDQAFADVRRCLKPGGVFVLYNYFRQGWLVARLSQALEHTFGEPPLVLTLPYRETVRPEQQLTEFTLFFAGDTGRLRNAFRPPGGGVRDYWLREDEAPGPRSPNGFETPRPEERRRWQRFGPANVVPPDEPLRTASDDWPFLYLRRPMIPDLSLRGMAVMGGLGLALLFLFLPRQQGTARRWGAAGQMFFLGAGFMLVETKAVVHMALLFGSTWMVNSVVFCAVLVMLLAANLFVLTTRPRRLWPYYLGLFAALVLNSLVPLDFFLGMSRGPQVAGACLLVFAPILFAGVVFAVAFGRSREPDRAFGANIAGALAGGLAEYSSMLLGFQYVVLVALGFYAVSAVLGAWARNDAAAQTR